MKRSGLWKVFKRAFSLYILVIQFCTVSIEGLHLLERKSEFKLLDIQNLLSKIYSVS